MMDLTTREEAIRLGLPRYFTGRPCIYGHVALRRTTNQRCTRCITEYQRTTYADNYGRWPKNEEARKRDNARRKAAHQEARARKARAVSEAPGG